MPLRPTEFRLKGPIAMKFAGRILRLKQLVGPAECAGEFDFQIVCVAEGAEPVIPDSICRKCGQPASQHSPSAQAGRIVQIIEGVDEACFTGAVLDRNRRD